MMQSEVHEIDPVTVELSIEVPLDRVQKGLDAGFGNGGFTTIAKVNINSSFDVAVDAIGRIYVGGMGLGDAISQHAPLSAVPAGDRDLLDKGPVTPPPPPEDVPAPGEREP